MQVSTTKPDIKTPDDIVLLVDTFYTKVRASQTIGYIFNDVAKVDWVKHLPVMYAFWESLLLNGTAYSGNPMMKHVALSKITPLTEKEFTEWLLLFTQTVDGLFEGATANEAKTRAANIARMMLLKIGAAAQ